MRGLERHFPPLFTPLFIFLFLSLSLFFSRARPLARSLYLYFSLSLSSPFSFFIRPAANPIARLSPILFFCRNFTRSKTLFVVVLPDPLFQRTLPFPLHQPTRRRNLAVGGAGCQTFSSGPAMLFLAAAAPCRSCVKGLLFACTSRSLATNRSPCVQLCVSRLKASFLLRLGVPSHPLTGNRP